MGRYAIVVDMMPWVLSRYVSRKEGKGGELQNEF